MLNIINQHLIFTIQIGIMKIIKNMQEMNTQFKDDKYKCTPKTNDMIKLIGNHRNSNYNCKYTK